MNAACRKRLESGLQRLRPRAGLPCESVRRRLSELEREALWRLLGGTLECVFDASFRTTQPARFAVRRFALVRAAAERPDGTPPDVLTAAEERTLFLRFNFCRTQMMRVVQRYAGRALDERGARMLLSWHHLAQEARAEIVSRNTSLVLAMARRTRVTNVEMDELVSEGNLALVRCVDKFDVARGFKFSTYVCRAVLACFSRLALGRTRARALCPVPYDPAYDRSDFLERKRTYAELACLDELKQLLFQDETVLSSVERAVLVARFNLSATPSSSADPPPKKRTLDDVGALLGVSKERIRQIQNAALRKLRESLQQHIDDPTSSKPLDEGRPVRRVSSGA
jgi:RNA polymerase sigma factor (sigma-70 family)